MTGKTGFLLHILAMTKQRALIIGASGGIGGALAEQLQTADVVTLSRRENGLDVTNEDSVGDAARHAMGPFDVIINAVGALEIDGVGPEKSIAALQPDAMLRQFALNSVGAALILKHFMGHLDKDRRSVFATLSARVGSIADNRLGGWTSYRASKAALNQIVKTTSIELSRSHKRSICVAIHPGTVRTDLTEKYLGNHPAVSAMDAAGNILRVIERLDVSDTGGFFDWRGDVVPW